MDNDQLTAAENPDEPFEIIMDQFELALTALQFQDSYSSEQACIKSKLTYNTILKDGNPDEMKYFKLFVDFIEVSSRFLKSVLFLNDERYKKSIEEFTIAKQLCEEGNTILSGVPLDETDDDDEGLIEVLRFLFAYFEHMIKVLYRLTQTEVDKQNGKYVDDIDSLRKAAVEIKDFDFPIGNIKVSTIGNMVVGTLGMLGRFSDTFEKKAERLEEKRKTIEYLTPIGNKIFIVHGHDEGILRELKEILEKKFNIHPVILKDEPDFGRTVIEKMEEYGRQCGFAFVIFTPDDIVENKKKKTYQARPNVLFELGWFCGRYGRSKVRIIRHKDTPLPSDLNGLVTFNFNENIEELYLKIETELKETGLLV
jgi:predicted nucleotide-binding protein